MLTTVQERLSRARLLLEGRGVVDSDLLSPEIAASWRRCLQAGLDPTVARVGEPDRSALRLARERHELAARLARAEMQGLYRQIAGSNFLIAFAAPDGTLLDAIADPSFGDAASAATISPGRSWTEALYGTNALGTSAMIGRPLMVHGPEHFLRSHAGLTCAAAPVFGPDGTLAGVLDASSDCRSRQRHTLALVRMAAAQIENSLFRVHHQDCHVIAFHGRGEFLHTLSAGLIALDDDGCVRGTNSQARFLLQDLPAWHGARFDALFETPWLAVLDGRHRLELRDHAGSTYAAVIETVQPCGPSVAARPAGPALPFVADDPAVREAVRVAEVAARRGVPLLIQGETGTGKEELARHAHAASGRRGAFVAVNCAAIPETLAEAELFGHAPGAFTGARRGGAPGLAAEADGGTLFLDEIGDLRPSLQGLLLRLLDDWLVRPVGGGAPRKLDVLLIAATNADLARAVSDKRFRADLFWRLNVAEVSLPPLAARADIEAVIEHVRSRAAPDLVLSPASRATLARRPWPGNVRELRNVLQRMALGGTEAILPVTGPADGLKGEKLARIRDAHRAAGGNVSRAARALGVSRNTIYRALR